MTLTVNVLTWPMERSNLKFATAADKLLLFAQLSQQPRTADARTRLIHSLRPGSGTANAKERATVFTETSHLTKLHADQAMSTTLAASPKLKKLLKFQDLLAMLNSKKPVHALT